MDHPILPETLLESYPAAIASLAEGLRQDRPRSGPGIGRAGARGLKPDRLRRARRPAHGLVRGDLDDVRLADVARAAAELAGLGGSGQVLQRVAHEAKVRRA
jgi:hypothetical protein